VREVWQATLVTDTYAHFDVILVPGLHPLRSIRREYFFQYPGLFDVPLSMLMPPLSIFLSNTTFINHAIKTKIANYGLGCIQQQITIFFFVIIMFLVNEI
jgi:hypothetical protein